MIEPSCVSPETFPSDNQDDLFAHDELVSSITGILACATSYLEAMHGTCLACHSEEADKRNRPELRECSTCHTSLTPRGAPGPVLARRQ